MVSDQLAPLFYTCMKVLCNPFLCSHHDTVSSLDVPSLHSHTHCKNKIIILQELGMLSGLLCQICVQYFQYESN